jgi:hypothetical protein
MNESDATKRSLQSCNDLATQRGWTGAFNDRNGKKAFIAACMQGAHD